jgi:hypothetical protein
MVSYGSQNPRALHALGPRPRKPRERFGGTPARLRAACVGVSAQPDEGAFRGGSGKLPGSQSPRARDRSAPVGNSASASAGTPARCGIASRRARRVAQSQALVEQVAPNRLLQSAVHSAANPHTHRAPSNTRAETRQACRRVSRQRLTLNDYGCTPVGFRSIKTASVGVFLAPTRAEQWFRVRSK